MLKGKFNFYLELALFLILGFLIGAIIKAEAVKRVTVGFNDSRASTLKQAYDFPRMQRDLTASQNSEGNSGQDSANQPGGSCSN